MDCLVDAIVNCLKNPHQIYKSLSHRFCTLATGSLLHNIQFIFGILHQWTLFISSQQHGTSLSPKEFDKPCLLSFSKWSKTIESKKLVQKIHNTVKQ